jgi:DNA-binding MarR family transcriptional regulator
MSTKNLQKLVLSVQEFQKFDKEMSTQAMLTFLLVAMWPGITAKELAERVETSQSWMSRIIGLLGKDGVRGREGYNLVTKVPDPRDPRRYVMHLTAKGKRVCETLVELHSGKD